MIENLTWVSNKPFNGKRVTESFDGVMI